MMPTIVAVVLLLWMIGILTAYTLGGLIHLYLCGLSMVTGCDVAITWRGL